MRLRERLVEREVISGQLSVIGKQGAGGPKAEGPNPEEE